MKFKLFEFVLLFFVFTSTSFSQINFSINPGLDMTGVDIGYKIGNFNPYIGFQFERNTYKYHYLNYSFKRTGPTSGKDFRIDQSYDSKADRIMFMPVLGVKYHFLHAKDFNSFANISINKADILRLGNLNELEYGFFKDLPENYWGAEFSLGIEYLISNNISIDGELGFKIPFGDSEIREVYQSDYFDKELNRNVIYETVISEEYYLNDRKPFFRINLNFYFD